MSDNDVVHYEMKRKYCEIILDRPPVNAFDVTLMRGLYNALIKADNDPKVRCVLIKSTGSKVFSAGVDTKWMMSPAPEELREFGNLTRLMPEKMLMMKKPIVSQVKASAIGMGMIVVMASDIRIFADIPFPQLFLKMPEVELSLNTGAGSSLLPVLTFGLSYGKSIMMTSDRLGLKDLPPRFATRIFPLDTIESDTESFMRDLASRKESIMFTLKTKMTIHNNQLIKRCFDLEQEVFPWEQKRGVSMEKWDEYISDLFKKYQ